MTIEALNLAAENLGLRITGAFHPTPDDGLNAKTVVLLSPAPNFWDVFSSSSEFDDGREDPIDRWSNRKISKMADEFSAEVYFPFGGPPYHPFIKWAVRTQQCYTSKVGLLVHVEMGLQISFRGAVGLPSKLDIKTPSTLHPCEDCEERPCLDACPSSALTRAGYDVPICKSYLRSPPGYDCMSGGCLVRRACPRSVGAARRAEQSALHMRAFRGE